MLDRRAFVRGVGSLTVAGVLAGCAGGGGSEETTTGGGETPHGDGEETTTSGGGGETTTAGGGETDGASGGTSAEVSSYLSGVSNFDGSIADRTGQSEVTVTVGAAGNDGNYAFAPPAIRVDAGTTVIWEWTGKGGQHNVIAESGADFSSELASEQGHTFSQTLDSAGVVTYYCEPHRSLGMKGAIVVE